MHLSVSTQTFKFSLCRSTSEDGLFKDFNLFYFISFVRYMGEASLILSHNTCLFDVTISIVQFTWLVIIHCVFDYFTFYGDKSQSPVDCGSLSVYKPSYQIVAHF